VDNLWQDTLLMLIGETDPDLSEQVKPGLPGYVSFFYLPPLSGPVLFLSTSYAVFRIQALFNLDSDPDPDQDQGFLRNIKICSV